jgi:hypothetical protein
LSSSRSEGRRRRQIAGSMQLSKLHLSKLHRTS